MKQRQCWYVCDAAGCWEDSPAEVTFMLAARAARSEGWHISADLDLCPQHRAQRPSRP